MEFNSMKNYDEEKKAQSANPSPFAEIIHDGGNEESNKEEELKSVSECSENFLSTSSEIMEVDSQFEENDIEVLIEKEKEKILKKLDIVMDKTINLKKRIDESEKKLADNCKKLSEKTSAASKTCDYEELRTYRMNNKMRNVRESLNVIEHQLDTYLGKK